MFAEVQSGNHLLTIYFIEIQFAPVGKDGRGKIDVNFWLPDFTFQNE